MKTPYQILIILQIICLLSINIAASTTTTSTSTYIPVNQKPTIIYVNANNTHGPWNGSQQHPYQHIQDAIDAAHHDDHIYVYNGEYTEHLMVNKTLTLTGENKATTIINGNYAPHVITFNASEIIFTNFTIKNSNGDTDHTGISIQQPNITIQSCRIYRTKTAIQLTNVFNILIHDCILIVNGEGISINHCQDISITSSYIAHNGIGLHAKQSQNLNLNTNYIHTNGIGIFITNSSSILFRTCEISKNCDNQGGLFIDNSQDLAIKNCNFNYNGVGIRLEETDTIKIEQTNLQYNTHFGIKARNNCTDFSILNCDISNNYRYALHIKDCSVELLENNIYNNYLYGLHTNNVYCDAKNNWWGSPLGPAYTGLTSRDRISIDPAKISFSPWKIIYITTSGSTWETEEFFTEIPLPPDTKRTITLSGTDSDGDQAPDWWEHKWGYNIYTWEDHPHLDPDNDALTNIEECYTDGYGSNPFHKDLFLEFDWIQAADQQATNRPSPRLTTLMKQRFAAHNITLHIDRGNLGGGEEIPYHEPFDYETLRDLYWEYFLHQDINNPRKGIFHYGLICDYGPGPGFSFIGWYNHDAFCISAQKLVEGSPLWPRDRLIMTGSLHELGHTLGLLADDHNGNDNREAGKPWHKDYWLYRNYKSSMNYRYTWQIFDYSEGTHGKGDFNDWATLDFAFFKNTRYGIPP